MADMEVFIQTAYLLSIIYTRQRYDTLFLFCKTFESCAQSEHKMKLSVSNTISKTIPDDCLNILYHTFCQPHVESQFVLIDTHLMPT
jgi:hypothetical protein